MKPLYRVRQKSDKNDTGVAFNSRKHAERYMRFVNVVAQGEHMYVIQETRTEDDGVPTVIMDVDTGQVVMWRWDIPYNKGYYPRTQPYRDRRVVAFPVKLMNDYPSMVQQAERLYAEWKESQ